jgi:hypothetical protein
MESIEMRYYPRYSSPTIFVFECDVCHGQIRVQNEQELTKCAICGKKLCPTCSLHGLCQADFARIPVEGQEKLQQITQKYDLAKGANAKKVRIIMGLLAIVVVLNIFFLFGVINLIMTGYGYFAFLGPVPVILMAVVLYRVSKQYPVFDQQRKAEQLMVVQQYVLTPNVPVPEEHFPPQPVQGQKPASNVKICSNCGQTLPPNAKFCEACGLKI